MIEKVTWGGVDLAEAYGMFLGSFEEEPPQPKTNMVEIPYGDDIDATEAVGPVAYENRLQTWTLLLYGRGTLKSANAAYEAVLNALNGKSADFTLSRDPDATYHGRASVTEATVSRHGIATLEVEVECSPWRSLGTVTKTVDASSGGVVTFSGPTKAVQPVFECEEACVIVWNGEEKEIPAGRFTVSDWYTESENTFFAVSAESSEYLVSEQADTVVSDKADEQAWGICYKQGGEAVSASASFEWKEL